MRPSPIVENEVSQAIHELDAMVRFSAKHASEHLMDASVEFMLRQLDPSIFKPPILDPYNG